MFLLVSVTSILLKFADSRGSSWSIRLLIDGLEWKVLTVITCLGGGGGVNGQNIPVQAHKSIVPQLHWTFIYKLCHLSPFRVVRKCPIVGECSQHLSYQGKGGG